MATCDNNTTSQFYATWLLVTPLKFLNDLHYNRISHHTVTQRIELIDELPYGSIYSNEYHALQSIYICAETPTSELHYS